MKAANQKKDPSLLLLTNAPASEPTHDEIALRAYSLWEQQGHPQNQDVATWLQAEIQLRQSPSRHGVRP